MKTAISRLGICLIAESYYPNIDGGAVHSRLLAKSLSKLDADICVITRRTKSSYPRRELVDGLSIVRFGLDNRLGRVIRYLGALGLCIPLIRNRSKYQIMVVSTPRIVGAPAVLLAKILGKQCVLKPDTCGEMDGTYVLMDVASTSLTYRLAKHFFRLRNRVLKHSDAFIAISDPIVDELLSIGVEAPKIAKIPNGVDMERFSPATEDRRRQLREAIGLSRSTMVFAFCGRLSREKGLILLLQVWRKLVGHFDNIHLLLIGSGDGMTLGCEGQLRSYVTQHNLGNSVTFTGPVDNVVDLLHCADVFVMPSWTETQCLALVEALACGLPAIATRVGGIPEVIDDGINGILVTLNDETELYDAAAHLILNVDKRNELGSMARVTAAQRFSISNIANRYMTVLSSVVREDKSH